MYIKGSLHKDGNTDGVTIETRVEYSIIHAIKYSNLDVYWDEVIMNSCLHNVVQPLAASYGNVLENLYIPDRVLIHDVEKRSINYYGQRIKIPEQKTRALVISGVKNNDGNLYWYCLYFDKEKIICLNFLNKNLEGFARPINKIVRTLKNNIFPDANFMNKKRQFITLLLI